MMTNVVSIDGAQYTSTVKLSQDMMMLPEQIQRANEYTYARHFVDRYVRIEIERAEELQDPISQCVTDIYEWLEQDFYESKQIRLDKLREVTHEGMREIVIRLLVGCTKAQEPELFTSITAQLSKVLGWGERKMAITTVSELLVPLARNNLISILRITSPGIGGKFKRTSIAVRAKIAISAKLQRFIKNTSFLPPMVCPPKILTRNNQSGHLTHDKSVTLNGYIKDPLALDTINTQNQMALTVDLEFLLNVPELPNKILDTAQKIQAWANFCKESNQMYLIIYEQTQSNQNTPGATHFNHKLDQRGRMYVEGYHINYQGSAFKKAMIEFADVRYIDVPEEYRISV